MSAVKTATQAIERHTPFTVEQIQATLEGRMTQFRRAVKGLPKPGEFKHSPAPDKAFFNEHYEKWWFVPGYIEEWDPSPSHLYEYDCPFGKVGDRLWIKETLCADERGMFYPADNSLVEVPDDFNQIVKEKLPAMLMPRWASRITVGITKIRAERLQDIKTRDIEAEGILQDESYLGSANRFRHPFIESWNKSNARRGYSWESNPFVWVVEFKRIQKSASASVLSHQG